MATNMQEALTFIEAIFDHTLVEETTLDLMLKDPAENTDQTLFGKKNSYDLGFEITTDHPNGLLLGHSGSTSGYWSYVVHFPDSRVTIAIAYNGDTEDKDVFVSLISMIPDLIDIAFE